MKRWCESYHPTPSLQPLIKSKMQKPSAAQLCPDGMSGIGCEHDFLNPSSQVIPANTSAPIALPMSIRNFLSKDARPIRYSDSGKPRKPKSHVPGTTQGIMP